MYGIPTSTWHGETFSDNCCRSSTLEYPIASSRRSRSRNRGNKEASEADAGASRGETMAGEAVTEVAEEGARAEVEAEAEELEDPALLQRQHNRGPGYGTHRSANTFIGIFRIPKIVGVNRRPLQPHLGCRLRYYAADGRRADRRRPRRAYLSNTRLWSSII